MYEGSVGGGDDIHEREDVSASGAGIVLYNLDGHKPPRSLSHNHAPFSRVLRNIMVMHRLRLSETYRSHIQRCTRKYFRRQHSGKLSQESEWVREVLVQCFLVHNNNPQIYTRIKIDRAKMKLF